MAMVPMTAMPQRTALSHAFGALAAALVGIAEYSRSRRGAQPLHDGRHRLRGAAGRAYHHRQLIAAAKLQGLVRGTPMTFKGQNVFNMALLLVMVCSFVYLLFNPGAAMFFYIMIDSPSSLASCW